MGWNQQELLINNDALVKRICVQILTASASPAVIWTFHADSVFVIIGLVHNM